MGFKTPTIELVLLGSVILATGQRLDVLLVRVTIFSHVVFVGIAFMARPLGRQLERRRTVIDAQFEVEYVPDNHALARAA